MSPQSVSPAFRCCNRFPSRSDTGPRPAIRRLRALRVTTIEAAQSSRGEQSDGRGAERAVEGADRAWVRSGRGGTGGERCARRTAPLTSERRCGRAARRPRRGGSDTRTVGRWLGALPRFERSGERHAGRKVSGRLRVRPLGAGGGVRARCRRVRDRVRCWRRGRTREGDASARRLGRCACPAGAGAGAVPDAALGACAGIGLAAAGAGAGAGASCGVGSDSRQLRPAKRRRDRGRRRRASGRGEGAAPALDASPEAPACRAASDFATRSPLATSTRSNGSRVTTPVAGLDRDGEHGAARRARDAAGEAHDAGARCVDACAGRPCRCRRHDASRCRRRASRTPARSRAGRARRARRPAPRTERRSHATAAASSRASSREPRSQRRARESGAVYEHLFATDLQIPAKKSRSGHPMDGRQRVSWSG